MLHTDTSLLPRARHARASWNTVTTSCGGDGGQVQITYDLTRLMGLAGDDADERFLVSLNQEERIDPGTIQDRTVFDHPVYDRASVAAQAGLPGIDGVRRTWFCGAYHGWGFHEDGCASGVRVARALGASS